jgi:hypothetical protein
MLVVATQAYSGEVEREWGVELDHVVFYQKSNALDISQFRDAFSRARTASSPREFVADYWNLLDIRDGVFDNHSLEFSATVDAERGVFHDGIGLLLHRSFEIISPIFAHFTAWNLQVATIDFLE